MPKSSEGKIALFIIIAVVIIFALFLTGGLFSGKGPRGKYFPQTSFSFTCCDTGDGEACKPQTGTGQTLTFQGQQYGLLRTRVVLLEGNLHLKDSGEKSPDGNPIILNSSDSHRPFIGSDNPECVYDTRDKFLKKYVPPEVLITRDALKYCTSIPNDEVIFVCKDKCHPATCTGLYFGSASCYGEDDSVYDVYFRLSDYPSPGVPNFIKNCDKSGFPSVGGITPGEQEIIPPTGEIDRKNLHLNTFRVKEGVVEGKVPWLSPYCKPAIYLYPEQKTQVSVKVAPQGNMSYTNPVYPKHGWQVTAYPDGKIDYQNSRYNYLYYEAEIPDDSYRKPNEGFVVKYANLADLLSTILPKLGLNEKESNEFSSYWLKVLPKSPYYFVGIIPKSELDTIAPLSITPTPDTTIRLTLYFEALDQPTSVKRPAIQTPKRTGFSVIEWGGIFKRDDKHNFSCFM